MWQPLESNYHKFYGKRVIIEKDYENTPIQGILTKIYNVDSDFLKLMKSLHINSNKF